MSNPIAIIGMVWYRREHYPRLLQLFKDRNKLPATYDQWLQQAELRKHKLEGDGHTIVQAYIDPNTFPAWCRERGLHIDAKARMEFANHIAAATYRHQH